MTLHAVRDFSRNGCHGEAFFHDHQTVGLLDAFHDGVEVQWADGDQIDDLRFDALLGQFVGGGVDVLQNLAKRDDRHVVPLAADVGFADRHKEFSVGDHALVAVHLFRLHDEHGVVVTDRRFQQAFAFVGGERSHDLQAWHGSVKAFVALAVCGGELTRGPVGPAEDDGHRVLATAHLKHLGRVVDDLV